MWTCRKCNAEVEDHFEICWSCGTSVDGAQDPGFRRFDADEDVPASADAAALKPSEPGTATVATYWVAGQAQEVQSRLEAIGVPVVVAYEFGVATDWFLDKATGSIHLQVAAADVDKARRFLADHPTAPLPPAPPKPPEPDEETRYKDQPWLAPVPKDLSPFEELRCLESQLSALIDSKDVPDWKVNPSFHPDVMAFIQRHANNVGFVQKAQGLQRNRAKYFATIRTQLLAPKPPEEEKPKEERPARPSVLRRLGGALVRRLVLGPLRVLRRLLKWTAILLIVAAVGVLLASGFYSAYAEKQLHAAVEETEEKDPNWTWEALQAQRKPIADKDNPALLLLAVGKQMPQGEMRPIIGDWGGGDGDPQIALNTEALDRIRGALKNHEPALADARRLADMSGGQWPDISPLDDHVRDLRAQRNDACAWIVDLLWLDALRLAQAQQPDRAFISVRAIMTAGQLIDDTSASLRAACAAQACLAIRRILAQVPRCSDADLGRLQQAFEEAARQPLCLRSLMRDRAILAEYRTQLAAGNVDAIRALDRDLAPDSELFTNKTVIAPLETWLRRGQYKLRLAQLLRQTNDRIELAKLPVEEQIVRFKAEGSSVGWSSQYDLHATVALLRCTSATLAVERYRLANGDWPRAWDQLVPKLLAVVPIDPYDGHPLRLRRIADGVLVYSIGRDGEDNGGENEFCFLGPKSSDGCDIVFRLWDVQHRGRPRE